MDLALGFLSVVEDFFNHLGSAGEQFPLIVRVDTVKIVRWGRRTVTVETEEGTETIFTDAELEPERVYFMRPLDPYESGIR